jgi:hypothetical protein
VATGTIPIKTPEGQAELSTRKRRVSQRHRTALFLIDGKRSIADVRSLGLQAGVPESCFDELLDMGLITLPEPARASPGERQHEHVDLPLAEIDERMASAPPAHPFGTSPDSLLPRSRTLDPESVSADSTLNCALPRDLWLVSEIDPPGALDPAFIEARIILLRAVRAEAPLAGSLTLLRLRRTRNRYDLLQLLAEVESRINKPPRSLAATRTMLRVRQLLDGRIDSSLMPA